MSSFIPLKGKDSKSQDFTSCTLILPAVSVGNIGQLCMDTLLCSLPGFAKIGYIHDPDVQSVVGNYALHTPDAKFCDESNALSLPVEVFHNTDYNLVALQQRAPLVSPARRAAFVSRLVAWISQATFRLVILISSSQSHRRTDKDLQAAHPFRYFLSLPIEMSKISEVASSLNWPVMMTEPSFSEHLQSLSSEIVVPAFSSQAAAEVEDHGSSAALATEASILSSSSPFSSPNIDAKWQDPSLSLKRRVVGGGITRQLFQQCTTAKIPLLGVVAFSTDSDNRQEGLLMTGAIWEFLHRYLSNYSQNCDSINANESNQTPSPSFPRFNPSTVKVPLAWTFAGGPELTSSIY